MTMKKKLLTLLLLASQTLVYAEGSALLITLKGGSQAAYIFSDKPVVTFTETAMSVKVADASTDYQRADISNFKFVDASEVAAIDQISEGSTLFEYTDGKISAAGAPIQVYSLSGHLQKSGSSSVSLADQPAGVYIVRMGKQVIKVRK